LKRQRARHVDQAGPPTRLLRPTEHSGKQLTREVGGGDDVDLGRGALEVGVILQHGAVGAEPGIVDQETDPELRGPRDQLVAILDPREICLNAINLPVGMTQNCPHLLKPLTVAASQQQCRT
jgi:hypothetical protein